MSNALNLAAPERLLNLVDDRVAEAIHNVQRLTLEDVTDPARLVGGEVQTLDFEDGTFARVPVLEAAKGWDDQSYLALALPYQQTAKPAMMLRAMVAGIAAPHARIAVLANNGLDPKEDAYSLTDAELARLNDGDYGAFGERQAWTLERICRGGSVALAGYSQGGRTAVSVAACSPDFAISAVVGYEIPSESGRPTKKLMADFRASGGYVDQRRAIKDSGIDVLRSKIYPPGKLIMDYGRFALSMRRPDSIALRNAMAGDIQDDLDRVDRNVAIVIGHVAGSKVFKNDLTLPLGRRIEVVRQEGPGIRRHPTGDNPILHALMVLDGMRHAQAA